MVSNSTLSAFDSYQAEQNARQTLVKTAIEQNKITVLLSMIQHGIELIEIEFDGSGDSGSIQTIDLKDKNQQPLAIHECVAGDERVFSSVEYDYKAKSYVAKTKNLTLYDWLYGFGYQILDHTEIDWYNNDGGFGSISLMLVPASEEHNETEQLQLTVTVNKRFTDYEQHDFEF